MDYSNSYIPSRFKSDYSLLKISIGIVFIAIIARFVNASQERV